jgi:ELWxxDGT repeat protein
VSVRFAIALCAVASIVHAASGPYLLKDLNHTALADRSPIGRGAGVKRQLFFNVCDELQYDDDDPFLGSCELWRSTGSRAGTRPLGRRFSATSFEAKIGDTLFFSGCRGGECGVWKTDGSARGTALAIPGFSGVEQQSVEVGGTVFFPGPDLEPDGTSYGELWKSDGTVAGTVRVANINDASHPADSGSYPRNLTEFGGAVYFAATNPETGRELWKTDGTTAGTVPAVDLLPGPTGTDPEPVTAAGGKLFFWAYGGTACCGKHLWASDGTPGGTVQLGTMRQNHGYLAVPLTHVGGTVFFGANDDSGGRELWKSNGTPQGTMRVADINPGPADSDPTGPGNSAPFDLGVAVVKDTVFFSAVEPTGGRELWKTDGSAAGTVRVADINPGPGGSDPYYFTPVGNSLFFVASEAGTGRELWKTDGTSAGTVRLTDIVAGPGGSVREIVGAANHRIFFVADDGTHGPELWALRIGR